MQFVVVGNPRVILTRNYMNDFLVKFQDLLDEFVDILVEDLPHSLRPIRGIHHLIDLISGASFPNKVAYKLTPQENE
jgi:hypothetical protein